MTTTNINAGPILFQNGSRILIADTTNLLNVLNVVDTGAALNIKPGIRSEIVYRDRGVLQDALDGDDNPSEVSFDVRFTSALTSKDLWIFLRGTAGATAPRKQFKFWIEIPDARGAIAGVEFGFTKAIIPRDGLLLESGDEADRLKIKFLDLQLMADPVRFSALRTTTT